MGIDEDPNVPFVYENDHLSAFATQMALAMKCNTPLEEVRRMATTSDEKKVVRSLEQAVQKAEKWTLHTDYSFDEHANRYFRVQGGRTNQGAWSLALEYKNLTDGFSDRII